MANIRLHGSELLIGLQLNEEYINQYAAEQTDGNAAMDLNYEVDRDYLWTSACSMASHKKLCEKLDPKYFNDTNRIFRMDYEKNMEAYIAQNPMDYLVLDLFYTYQASLAILDGEIYTCNGALKHSEFYVDYRKEFRIVPFEELPEEEWHSYIDKYIAMISKYYDKDHMILVRSNYAKEYVEGQKVATWERDDVDLHNQGLRRLEDYFIQKTDCYSIDLAKYYRIAMHPKKGLIETNFEKEFFKVAASQIYKIIEETPKQRVFDAEPYSKLLSNYVAHFEEGNILDENGYCLQQKDLVDSLVLTMNKWCVERYWNDFTKMKEMEPKSLEEILTKYDFWCSIDLHDMIQAIIAVQNKDLYNEKVNYQVLAKFENNYREDLMGLIAMEVKQVFDLPVQKVTIDNAGIYQKFLLYYKNKDKKSFKRYQKELDKELKHTFNMRREELMRIFPKKEDLDRILRSM